MSLMGITEENYYNAASMFQTNAGFTKTYSETVEETNTNDTDFASMAKEAINNYLTQANFSSGANFGDISNNMSAGASASDIANSKNNSLQNSDDFNIASGITNTSTNATSTQSGTVNNSYMQLNNSANVLHAQMQLASMRK